MRITLDSRDIAGLKTALETILSPSLFDGPAQWGSAVMREAQTLLGADQLFFALPLDGSVHVIGNGERTEEAGRDYERDYWQTDRVIGERRKALGLEVHHQDQLYEPGEIRTDVLFNEWCKPNKLFDTLGMAVDVSDGPLPAGVNAYHDRASSRPFGERGKVLMHLMLPAFKASVRSYSQLVRLRQSMSQLVDQLRAGACLLNVDGTVLYQNQALNLLFDGDPEADALRRGVRRVGGAVTAFPGSPHKKNTGEIPTGSAFERIETATNTYEIRGTRFGEMAASADAVAIVMVDAFSADHTRRKCASERVRAQYSLTKRETEVALLLARRFTAEEIATTVGISVHTARHHTEKIFAKTGVTSRNLIERLFDL